MGHVSNDLHLECDLEHRSGEIPLCLQCLISNATAYETTATKHVTKIDCGLQHPSYVVTEGRQIVIARGQKVIECRDGSITVVIEIQL